MKNLFFLGFLFFTIFGCTVKPKYEIAPSPMLTPFAQTVDTDTPFPEYPRPQMEREEWMNLNGLWDYTVKSIDFEPVQGLTTAPSWTTGEVPSEWTGKILVPFAIDAPLSSVGRILQHNEAFWYQRTFKIPSNWKKKNVLLHFAASDWETSVYINGEKLVITEEDTTRFHLILLHILKQEIINSMFAFASTEKIQYRFQTI